MRKCGITRGVKTQEVSRISHNHTRDTGVAVQTYFGGDSDGLVNVLTGIESPWLYTGLRMGDYAPGNHRDRPVTGELYLIVDVERRMYECPRLRGTLQGTPVREGSTRTPGVDEGHRHRIHWTGGSGIAPAPMLMGVL